MRSWWLIVAACSGAATPSPPVAVHAPSGAGDTRPAAVRATSTQARITVHPSGAWVDILIEGTDARAREMCAWLVEREQAAAPSTVRQRVARDCEATPLPIVRASRVRLVTTEVLDDDVRAVAEMLRQGRPDTTERPALRGQVAMHEPFADLVACEATRVQLDATEHREWLDFQRQEDEELERRLTRARADEVEQCQRAAVATEACTKQRADARTQCLLDAQPSAIVCSNAERERKQLDAMRARPRTPPPSNRACRSD